MSLNVVGQTNTLKKTSKKVKKSEHNVSKKDSESIISFFKLTKAKNLQKKLTEHKIEITIS